MDIHPLTGSIVPAEDDPNAREIFIPVVFTGVPTGPPGILQFSFHCTRSDVVVTGAARVHKYEADSTAVGAAAAIVNSRPVYFQDEGAGKNTLVFSSRVELPVDVPRLQFRLNLQITFVTLAFLSIPLSLDVNLKSGTLTVKAIRRPSADRQRAVVSLALLLLLLLGLGAWSHRIASQVYERGGAFFSATVISAIMGSLLTFLGLSFGRLRAWFALVSDLVAVVTWPELHINPTLYRLLSRRSSLAALLAVALSSCWFVYQTRSALIPRPSGATLADSENSWRTVSEPRLLVRDLVEASEPRFYLVCDSAEPRSVGRPFSLATVSPEGRLDHVILRFTLENGQTQEMPAFKWLQASLFEPGFLEKAAQIRGLLCGPSLSPGRVTIGEEQAQLDRMEVSRLHVKFGESIEWDAEALQGWVSEFPHAGAKDLPGYKGLDWSKLYAERVRYSDALLSFIQKKSGEGRMRGSQLASFAASALQPVVNSKREIDRKRAVERGIQLRAVWSAFGGERRSEELSEADIDRLATRLGELLSHKYPGFEPFFSLVEAALVLQASDPGMSGSYLHRAVLAGLESAIGSGAGRGLSLDYAATFLISDASRDPSAPQWCFFRDQRASLERLHGSRQRIQELVGQSNVLRGADSARKSELDKVSELWRENRSCRP